MKFPAFAFLASSFLVQSIAAYQPGLRLSATDEVASCFDKCGKKGSEKASKIEQCQAGCVDTAVTGGATRSAVGRSGKYSFVIHLTQARSIFLKSHVDTP
jgi:hypothetical protein